MIYITKPTMFHPAQDVQEEKHRKYLQGYNVKAKTKLQENTHTRNGVFPPIMVRIDKIHLFGP